VLELARGGTLADHFYKQGCYSEAEIVVVSRLVLATVAECHSKNVIYRDIKMENFVYMTTGRDSALKAIDFGLAAYKPAGSPNLKDFSGTPYYVAPEVIEQDYSFECDLWSVGVLLYILLSGKRPFTGNLQLRGVDLTRSVLKDVRDNEVSFRGRWFEKLSPTGQQFLRSLLVKDPKQRMTANEAINHPWLKSPGQQKQSNANFRLPVLPLSGKLLLSPPPRNRNKPEDVMGPMNTMQCPSLHEYFRTKANPRCVYNVALRQDNTEGFLEKKNLPSITTI